MGFLGCMRSYKELPSPELEDLGVSLLSGVLLLAFLCIFSLSSRSFSACFLSLSSLFLASWLLGTGLKVRSVRVHELNSPRFQ